MAYEISSLGERLLQRRALRLWQRAAERAGSMDPARLKGLRQRARQLRRQLDEVLAATDSRLGGAPDGGTIPRPLHSDWAHRPQPWRAPVLPAGRAAAETRSPIGGEVTLFHDCTAPEIAYRQVRNRDEESAPFGLCLEVFRFDGTFLSLAIDLPEAAARGLQRRHLIRLEASIETERPLEIFARLNVRHGPNTEQVVRELPAGGPGAAVDFDLAYTKLNEKRVEKIWLDLIFEGPEMNAVLLRDVTLTRRPRAEF